MNGQIKRKKESLITDNTELIHIFPIVNSFARKELPALVEGKDKKKKKGRRRKHNHISHFVRSSSDSQPPATKQGHGNSNDSNDKNSSQHLQQATCTYCLQKHSKPFSLFTFIEQVKRMFSVLELQIGTKALHFFECAT